jgi:diacylglycerol kinase (ATP)
LRIPVELVATQKSHHAAALAREAIEKGCDLIVACGGDGTLNEVINGMAGSGVPLLQVPAGTANVLAAEIGLPCGFRECLDLLRIGAVRRISLGKSDGRYFILMAGIGVDAAIIEILNGSMKRFLGEVAYWITGFGQFFRYPFPRFSLVIDGKREEATFAVISKSRFYGGGLRIAAHADFYSREFDVCFFKCSNRWRYLYYLIEVLRGKHLQLPDVGYLKARDVVASGDPAIGVQVDGELSGKLPQKFTIEPDALSLIVPR